MLELTWPGMILAELNTYADAAWQYEVTKL